MFSKYLLPLLLVAVALVAASPADRRQVHGDQRAFIFNTVPYTVTASDYTIGIPHFTIKQEENNPPRRRPHRRRRPSKHEYDEDDEDDDDDYDYDGHGYPPYYGYPPYHGYPGHGYPGHGYPGHGSWDRPSHRPPHQPGYPHYPHKRPSGSEWDKEHPWDDDDRQCTEHDGGWVCV